METGTRVVISQEDSHHSSMISKWHVDIQFIYRCTNIPASNVNYWIWNTERGMGQEKERGMKGGKERGTSLAV